MWVGKSLLVFPHCPFLSVSFQNPSILKQLYPPSRYSCCFIFGQKKRKANCDRVPPFWNESEVSEVSRPSTWHGQAPRCFRSNRISENMPLLRFFSLPKDPQFNLIQRHPQRFSQRPKPVPNSCSAFTLPMSTSNLSTHLGHGNSVISYLDISPRQSFADWPGVAWPRPLVGHCLWIPESSLVALLNGSRHRLYVCTK